LSHHTWPGVWVFDWFITKDKKLGFCTFHYVFLVLYLRVSGWVENYILFALSSRWTILWSLKASLPINIVSFLACFGHVVEIRGRKEVGSWSYWSPLRATTNSFLTGPPVPSLRATRHSRGAALDPTPAGKACIEWVKL
jgi:hypothetical protein